MVTKNVTEMVEKAKKLWSKTNRWHRGLLLFLIVELKLVPGGQVGFTCNDPALSYPFTGDTITWKHLFITILLLPLAIMLVVERKCHADKVINPKQQALKWYKEYLFGVLINMVVVQTLKLIVGSPRPHFFDTCSPNEALTCKGSEYVPRYTCTKAHWLNQSDRSFPSGHTSLASHAGLFLIYYLHKRSVKNTPVLVIQAVLLVSTVFCGVSRMLDHRHHWWDVMAGVTLGIPILGYTIINMCNNFESSEEVHSSEISKSDNQHSSTIPLIDAKHT